MDMQSLFSSIGFADSEASMVTFKLLTFFVGALGLGFCFFGYKVQRVYIALIFGLMMGGVGGVIGAMVGSNAGAAVLFG
ncbi:MAG: hypothetical protein RR937_07945, partial [Ruthenibacterium sp.]